MRELLHESDAKVIWTRVPEGGEAAFWREFCRALEQALPLQSENVETLQHMGYPADAVLTEAARDVLLSMDFGPKTVLVLDDIHLLTADKTEAPSFSGGPTSKTEPGMAWQNGVTGGGMGKLCELLVMGWFRPNKSGMHKE